MAYELNQAEWTTDNQQADAVVRIDYAGNNFAVNTFTVSRICADGGSEPDLQRRPARPAWRFPPWDPMPFLGQQRPSTRERTRRRLLLVLATHGTSWGIRTCAELPSGRSHPPQLLQRRFPVSGVKDSYEHTGSPIRPNVTVTHNGRTLKAATDYQVSMGRIPRSERRR